MQIKSSDNIKTEVKIHSLSIADSGKGKTHFIGTMCDHAKPFVIDCEKGLLTISDKQFDYVQVDTYAQFKEAFNWYMQEGYKNYTHIVIDSMSRLQQYLVNDLADDKGKITMNQWGEILATLRKIVDYLTKSCPTSSHVTTMAAESKDELTGHTKIYPNIQGAFRYDLAGYFDLVFYHDCGQGEGGRTKYWIQTEGDQRVVARSRLNSVEKLPKFIDNDYKHVAQILTKLKGE